MTTTSTAPADRLATLLHDLATVRDLPAGHPDREAWRRHKAEVVELLDDADQADLVPHPDWCVNLPDGARSAPPEPGREHEGRDLRLDVGETYAWSLSLALVQMYEDDVLAENMISLQPPRIRLSLVENESVGEAYAYVSATEARAFARMLDRQAGDLERFEARS